MIHFTDVSSAQKLCECLAAPARMEILKLVLSRRADSLDSLAKTLHLTNGAITQHVKKLCDAGLIKLIETPGKRGIAKCCVVAADRIIIDVASDIEGNDSAFDLPVGSFSAAAIKPYCAIATPSGWIGERDDPRYFTYPERANAGFIYFNSGRMTWQLPAPAKKNKPLSLSVSFEISSKPHGYGHSRDAEVTFFMGDIRLGSHIIDGEFTDRKGLFTPAGFKDVCQYGKYKTVKIDGSGTYFDGIRIGAHTIAELDMSAPAFSVATDSGIAIFGNGFGDYDCGIKVDVKYE